MADKPNSVQHDRVVKKMQRSGAIRRKERPIILRSQVSVTFALDECDESESSISESQQETETRCDDSDLDGDVSGSLGIHGEAGGPRPELAEHSDHSAEPDKLSSVAAGETFGCHVNSDETDR